MNRKKAQLYLHCGLHKTGTTALQMFLRNNTGALQEVGIRYPYVGCLDPIGSGHHNIAWQLAKDRRFDRALGDIEALARDIDSFPGDILLSSEDFESSLGNPEAFSPLVQYALSTQREVVIVLYVRDQISYLESLYCELLEHGLDEEYRIVANQVITNKKYSIREWVFHFDYLQIPRRFASIRNLRFVFRNYHTLAKGSISADFASILPLAPAVYEKSLNLRSNERKSPLDALRRFYENRINRALSAPEIEVIQHLCQQKRWPMRPGKTLYDLFVARFLKANKRFSRKYKVPPEGLIFDRSRNAAGQPIVLMDRFFSVETQSAILEMATNRARSDLSRARQMETMTLAKEALEAWWTDRTPKLPVVLAEGRREQKSKVARESLFRDSGTSMNSQADAPKTLPYPPLDLLQRTGHVGNDNPQEAYHKMGFGIRGIIESMLPAPWSWDGARVLDFGCGAGRILRQFLPESGRAEFWGCDIDEASIRWLKQNLCPPFNALNCNESPGLSFSSGFFSVIYAISVFTHLTDYSTPWLLELHRILEPGGLLFATFLGEGMIQELIKEEWDDKRIGFNTVLHGNPWDQGGPLAFISPWWIRAHWGRVFEVVELRPHTYKPTDGGKPQGHGLVLLRKRAVELSSEEVDQPEPNEPRELAALRHNVKQLSNELINIRRHLATLERMAD